MNIEIKPYTKDRIEDVVRFEEELRLYENIWGWEIDEAYLQSVKESFENPLFHDSLSFLAYCGGRVVGRIDSSMIRSRFDGSTKAYLDWICVLKSERHLGAAQALLAALRAECKARGVSVLIALMANNDEAVSFYKSVGNASMHDTGIWIDI